MSDNYITVCPVNEVENPEELSERMVRWLQAEEIIEKEMSDCVLSTKKQGYKPGTRHTEAVGMDEDILRLQTCGLEIKTEREVFTAMGLTALTEIICPKCGHNRFEGISQEDFYMDRLSREQTESFHQVFDEFNKWAAKEATSLECPNCKVSQPLEAYKIGDTVALSNLGFTFWNWPQLTPDFLKKFEDILGREVKVIYGHI